VLAEFNCQKYIHRHPKEPSQNKVQNTIKPNECISPALKPSNSKLVTVK
jgi:hypothetical protein